MGWEMGDATQDRNKGDSWKIANRRGYVTVISGNCRTTGDRYKCIRVVRPAKGWSGIEVEPRTEWCMNGK